MLVSVVAELRTWAHRTPNPNPQTQRLTPTPALHVLQVVLLRLDRDALVLVTMVDLEEAGLPGLKVLRRVDITKPPVAQHLGTGRLVVPVHPRVQYDLDELLGVDVHHGRPRHRGPELEEVQERPPPPPALVPVLPTLPPRPLLLLVEEVVDPLAQLMQALLPPVRPTGVDLKEEPQAAPSGPPRPVPPGGLPEAEGPEEATSGEGGEA